MNTEREDRAIDGWCAVLGRIEKSPITVVEHPDRERPGQGGCDAIVDRKSTRHAVEHTSLDTYLRRRADDDRFRKVVLPIADAIENVFPDSWVELEVPVHGIPTGEDWKQLRDRLLARCIEAVGSMPIASYHDLTRTRFDWPLRLSSRRPLPNFHHVRGHYLTSEPTILAQRRRRAPADCARIPRIDVLQIVV